MQGERAVYRETLPRLADGGGHAIASKRAMALCRGGASKNKPFCDGSHWHVAFKNGNE